MTGEPVRWMRKGSCKRETVEETDAIETVGVATVGDFGVRAASVTGCVGGVGGVSLGAGGTQYGKVWWRALTSTN
jgi:hypothetical protein